LPFPCPLARHRAAIAKARDDVDGLAFLHHARGDTGCHTRGGRARLASVSRESHIFAPDLPCRITAPSALLPDIPPLSGIAPQDEQWSSGCFSEMGPQAEQEGEGETGMDESGDNDLTVSGSYDADAADVGQVRGSSRFFIGEGIT
jgi:hypothetical protein